MESNTRLVIADVDGTLVTQNKVLTARAIEAVKQLRDASIAFSITSGRPPLGMKMLIDALALTEPIAAFYRGVLVRPDLSVMAQTFVPADVAARVIEAIVRHGLDCWVYTDRDWLVRDANAPHVAREQWTVKFAPWNCFRFQSAPGSRGQDRRRKRQLRDSGRMRSRCATRVRQPRLCCALAAVLSGRHSSGCQQGSRGHRALRSSVYPASSDCNDWGHAERCTHVPKERAQYRYGERRRRRVTTGAIRDYLERRRRVCCCSGSLHPGWPP